MASKKSSLPTDLRSLRSRVKKLDAELVSLLRKRREIAHALAEREGASELLPRLERDAARLGALAKGLDPGVVAVLREAIAAERNAVEPVRVAYLGPANTFSHQAAEHRFGATAELAPVGTIAAVFEAVDRGDCQFGVVPLENSTDGRVTDTLDCFSRTEARICGELPLRIHHCLLGAGERASVRHVLSKPQALSQCRNWLAQHLPGAEARPVASTADAARQALADPSIAAIASERAAVQLGLAVLARNIEDQKDNITRFAVIGREPAAKSKGENDLDKSALMFEMPHEPGALADAMAIFKRHKLNLTWIESFPQRCEEGAGSRGRYLFFVELEGHQTELMPRRAIAALGKKATQLAVLGSYPTVSPIG
ncbi:MAG: prephenate dehydratase [Planctomycetota bacterium]